MSFESHHLKREIIQHSKQEKNVRKKKKNCGARVGGIGTSVGCAHDGAATLLNVAQELGMLLAGGLVAVAPTPVGPDGFVHKRFELCVCVCVCVFLHEIVSMR